MIEIGDVPCFMIAGCKKTGIHQPFICMSILHPDSPLASRPMIPVVSRFTTHRKARLIACGCACVMTCEAAPPALVLLSESIIDDKALVTPVGFNFAGAMNGFAYQNDILVSHNGWQYTAWYDTVGTDQSVWLARRAILGPTSGKWEKFDSGSDLLNADEDSWDTHNTISLGISKADGTLHMSWDHHVHDLRYRRSLAGLATYADSEWNASRILAEQDWLTSSGNTVKQVTYPMFITTPEDTLLFN